MDADILTRNKVIIEPKTFFANERTYLQWFNAATMIASVGVGLLGISDTSKPLGVGAIAVALLVLLYAGRMFHKRVFALQSFADSSAYVDIKGPTIITVTMVIALTITATLYFVDRNQVVTTDQFGSSNVATTVITNAYEPYESSVLQTYVHHMKTMAFGAVKHVHTMAVGSIQQVLNIDKCIVSQALSDVGIPATGVFHVGSGPTERVMRVSNNGFVIMSPAGIGSQISHTSVTTRLASTGYFEGITMVDLTSDLYYIATQDTGDGPLVYEYDFVTNEFTRTFKLREFIATLHFPISGIAFVPVPNTLEGGYMYVSSSFDGSIYVYEFTLNSNFGQSENAIFVTKFRLVSTRRDLQDLSYDRQTSTMYAVYPSIEAIVAFKIDNVNGLPSDMDIMDIAVTSYHLPLRNVRAIAIDPIAKIAYAGANIDIIVDDKIQVSGHIFRSTFDETASLPFSQC